MIQPTTLSLQKESDVERMQVSCAKPTRITPAPIRFRVQITDYISLHSISSPVNDPTYAEEAAFSTRHETNTRCLSLAGQ